MSSCRTFVAITALALIAVACGDDDEDTASTTGAPVTIASPSSTGAPEETNAPDATVADTATGGTAATGPSGTGDEPEGELVELCALAEELYNQESPPTAEQLTKYQELAPDEIRDVVDPLAEALIPIEGDFSAFFNVLGDDEMAEREEALNEFEEENCGIERSAEAAVPAGATQEAEDDAKVVEVTATDYEFTYEPPTESGRTSFVLTNEGEEAHFLFIGKLAEGVSLQEALESENPDGMVEMEWETKLAAAGGDEEVITFDLEPGNYGMVCFVPADDGTPHAFLGMTSEFAVEQ